MEFFTINKRIAHILLYNYRDTILPIATNASLEWAHNYRDTVSTQRTVIAHLTRTV